MSETVAGRVRALLTQVYPDRADELDDLASRLLDAARLPRDVDVPDHWLPGADEVVLITYGDTFVKAGQPHLRSLAQVWQQYFGPTFSTVHVLPFFPSSSDGGFAVVDYRQVDPELGDWSDLARVGATEVMADLVCNHGSAQNEWFAQFIANELPGRDYFVTAEPDADTSMVTRPRTHPLLAEVETSAGTRHVWATFSHDQVDFDFGNPDVLVEFCEILGHYVSRDVSRIRLDAIAYLWKELGTSCVHLPQTHAIVKLMRLLVQARNPQALTITETNVPHEQNVSYFGDGDEAQVVYNFTLAPLIAWSLVTARADVLNNWLEQLDAPPTGCTFLNFIASHDGIGLRPVEDLIGAPELVPLLDAAAAVGGSFSSYATPEGPRPYELNVGLADLLAGTNGVTAPRFVLAHALMVAVQGIPALYVHSMLVTPGDTDEVEHTGHNRDINRPQLKVSQVHERLAQGWRADVFRELSHLIKVRSGHPAFAPESEQVVVDVHPQVVAIGRGSGTGRVLAAHNLSANAVQFRVPEEFGLHDVITNSWMERDVTLQPWAACWLAF